MSTPLTLSVSSPTVCESVVHRLRPKLGSRVTGTSCAKFGSDEFRTMCLTKDGRETSNDQTLFFDSHS